jgi:hypothetical protein
MARGPLAGASGPGKFSKRTDMSLGSIAYGEGVETQAIKSGAPMARTPDTRGMPAGEVREAAMQEQITPLFAPSTRSGEPITSGIPMGEGPGPEVLGAGRQTEKYSDTLAKLLPFDESGEIAVLYQDMLARGL